MNNPLAFAASSVHLNIGAIDYAIILIYFGFVLMIGVLLRSRVRSAQDYFESRRSLPSWITGMSFMAANLGALEVMGMGAGAAQYGVMMADFYWIGAIPAMVFVGWVMIRFYYRSGANSVPGYLRRRYNEATRGYQAGLFLLMTLMMGGINMYAMALIINFLLNIPFDVSLWVASGITLFYILMGGLSSAIYNEVLQLFMIFVGLIPLTILGFIAIGGLGALQHAAHVPASFTHIWKYTGSGHNPFGVSWIPIVFGLGFVLSFGYWGTDFLVMQRAMAARDEPAAKRTPLLAAFPKIVFPFLAIWPGLAALTFVHLSASGPLTQSYNMAIPDAMAHFYPSGLLGVGLVALIASFMSGQAGNVSAFNTIWTYDIYKSYIRPDSSDEHLVWMGRLATVAGTLIAVGTAYWVRSFSTIINYEQLIFSIINAPLLASVLLGMFWKRTTAKGAFVGLMAGNAGALAIFFIQGTSSKAGAGLGDTYWRALISWGITMVVTVAVTLVTKPKPDSELENLTWSLTTPAPRAPASELVWYKRPALLGCVALAIALGLNIYYA